MVEAQALGVPIISTDCPFGPRELLPAQNLVSLGDIEGLASLMNQVTAHPHSYLQRHEVSRALVLYYLSRFLPKPLLFVQMLSKPSASQELE
nr:MULTISPECIES: hypothetical protein [Psychrobacter]